MKTKSLTIDNKRHKPIAIKSLKLKKIKRKRQREKSWTRVQKFHTLVADVAAGERSKDNFIVIDNIDCQYIISLQYFL